MKQKDKGGRPRLTEEQKTQRKEILLQRIEPYLKSGLNVSKTLKEARIHNSEFYKYMDKDEFFKDEVYRFKQYISILVNSMLFHHLVGVTKKQNGDKAKNIPPQVLSREDIHFLWWFALNANTCHEEWGRRSNTKASLDPREEMEKIKALLEEETTL